MMVELAYDQKLSAHAHAADAALVQPIRAAPPPSRVCFSFAAYAGNVIHHLLSCQVQVEKGLSDEEFARVELEFGFTFPPDLKAILQQGLPVGDGFPNWRLGGSSALLRLKLNAPISGFCYEVGKGRFWWKDWGFRPPDPHQAMAIARSLLRKAPILVPICKDCYIPSTPSLAGNPVFFVDRKEVGYSGFDLADFFQRQSFIPKEYNTAIDPSAENTEDSCELRPAVLRDMPKKYMSHGRTGDGAEPLELTSVRVLLQGSGWKFEGFARDVEGRKADAGKENTEAQSRGTFRSFKDVIPDLIQDIDLGPEYGPKGAQVSPRSSVSRGDFPRRSIDVPTTQTLQPSFTISAPAWAAKQPRYIEFWSDLAENTKQICLMKNESLCNASKGSDPSFTIASAQGATGLGSKWVERYLDSMAGQLRDGGWKESEISEMVDAHAYPDSSCKLKNLDKQSVLEDLTAVVNVLSISLKQSGWTAQEVEKILGASHERENAKWFAANVEKLTSKNQLARA